MWRYIFSVADPDPFDTDTDPAFHFDTDSDPAFQFDPDPGPTVWYGSGYLLFQRGTLMYLKQYFLYIFTWFFLSVGPTGPTQEVFFVKFSLPVNFVVPSTVLWSRNNFLSDPDSDPAVTLISDPDPACLWKIHWKFRSSKQHLNCRSSKHCKKANFSKSIFLQLCIC